MLNFSAPFSFTVTTVVASTPSFVASTSAERAVLFFLVADFGMHFMT